MREVFVVDTPADIHREAVHVDPVVVRVELRVRVVYDKVADRNYYVRCVVLIEFEWLIAVLDEEEFNDHHKKSV